MSLRKSLLLIAILALTPEVVLGADAADLLRKAQVADRHVSYRGMKTAVVYMSGKPAECSLKIVHLLPDRTRTEYFSPSALAGVVVIENGPMLWRYCPCQRVWEGDRSSNTPSPELIHQEAMRNFEIRVLGKDTVAGRPTYVIHATPRSSNESARRIWVDQDYYLVMRTQVEDARGAVLNSSRYSSIEINPRNISPSLFKVKGRVRNASAPASRPFKPIRPTYLPRGYRLVGMSTMNVNGLSCAHIQFSNGSSVISLFERRTDCDRPPVQKTSKTMRVITWSRNGVLFTLMGAVPCPELRKMADSTKQGIGNRE